VRGKHCPSWKNKPASCSGEQALDGFENNWCALGLAENNDD